MEEKLQNNEQPSLEEALPGEGEAVLPPEAEVSAESEALAKVSAELAEAKDKYLRLYAEFENYKKRTQRDKEDLIKYSNEMLIAELLPSIDHLEIALKHVEEKNGLVQGVEMTLRELLRTLEKFGLKQIEALGKTFNPEFHEAVSTAERDDVEEGTIVEEMRKGYIYRDKVLRASLVSVSKKPKKEDSEVQINIEQ